MKRLLIPLCMLALISVGCNNEKAAEETAAPTSTFNLAAAKDSIAASNAAFASALANKDSAGVAALYTSDAVLMPANMPVFTGSAAITSFMGEGIRGGMNSISLVTTEVFGAGDMVTEVGTYTLSFGPDQDKGKYIVIWKNEGGKWKMFRDIFNSDNPPPPAPAPAKK